MLLGFEPNPFLQLVSNREKLPIMISSVSSRLVYHTKTMLLQTSPSTLMYVLPVCNTLGCSNSPLKWNKQTMEQY